MRTVRSMINYFPDDPNVKYNKDGTIKLKSGRRYPKKKKRHYQEKRALQPFPEGWLSYIEEYRQALRFKNLATGTVRIYLEGLQQVAASVPIPQNLTTWHIERWVEMHLAKTSAVHINAVVASILRFYDFLIHKKCFIGENPARSVQRLQVPFRLPKFLTIEQIAKIISKIPQRKVREYALILTLYKTGLRLHELRKLKYEDITDKGLRVIGKMNKERYVQLSSDVIEAINALPKHRQTFKHPFSGKHAPPSEYVFGSLESSGMLSKSVIVTLIDVTARKAGIKGVTPNQFRHSFATHLVDARVDFGVIAKQMGHASPATTMIYAQVSKTIGLEAVNKLPVFVDRKMVATVEEKKKPTTESRGDIMERRIELQKELKRLEKKLRTI